MVTVSERCLCRGKKSVSEVLGGQSRSICSSLLMALCWASSRGHKRRAEEERRATFSRYQPWQAPRLWSLIKRINDFISANASEAFSPPFFSKAPCDFLLFNCWQRAGRWCGRQRRPQADPAGGDTVPAQHRARGASRPADLAAATAPLGRVWRIKGLHWGLKSLFLQLFLQPGELIDAPWCPSGFSTIWNLQYSPGLPPRSLPSLASCPRTGQGT